MYNYLPSFDSLIKNKQSIIIIFLVIGIFIGISIFYYLKIFKPKIDKKYIANKEYLPHDENDNNSNLKKNATLYYFYTNWCPHCKVAKPEWEAFKSDSQGMVKGVKIIFKEIDCDQDIEIADKFKVNGYPSIKLVYENKIYDYDAKPNKETLYQFLNSIL